MTTSLKPYSPREVVARVRAVLRRSTGTRPADPARCIDGDLEIDLEAHSVTPRRRTVGTDPHRVQPAGDLDASSPGGSSPACSCSRPSRAWPMKATSAPSTPISRTCAPSWNSTRASRATSRPCLGSATVFTRIEACARGLSYPLSWSSWSPFYPLSVVVRLDNETRCSRSCSAAAAVGPRCTCWPLSNITARTARWAGVENFFTSLHSATPVSGQGMGAALAAAWACWPTPACA